MRCLAPLSPASKAISTKKRRAQRTGLPRLPPTVGTQIARPSTGLKAAIRRLRSAAPTPGMSPNCTTAASALALSAAMPVRTDVLRPWAKSGLVTKRRRDRPGIAASTAALTCSAMWPSTTTISTAWDSKAAFTAWTTSGSPLASASILFGPPIRVDRPAARTKTATRGACCGPSASEGSLSSRGCGRLAISASRPPAPMRTISARLTGSPAASRSSTMSKPLYLGDLAQPGRPSTGMPSSSAVNSRLPGSTGMPKCRTVPPASAMPSGTTSCRSTMADAPAIRKRSQPSFFNSWSAEAMAPAS